MVRLLPDWVPSTDADRERCLAAEATWPKVETLLVQGDLPVADALNRAFESHDPILLHNHDTFWVSDLDLTPTTYLLSFYCGRRETDLSPMTSAQVPSLVRSGSGADAFFLYREAWRAINARLTFPFPHCYFGCEGWDWALASLLCEHNFPELPLTYHHPHPPHWRNPEPGSEFDRLNRLSQINVRNWSEDRRALHSSRQFRNVLAIISCPRLGYLDFFRSLQTLAGTGIRYRTSTHPNWAYGLADLFEQALHESSEDPRITHVLTLDYDTLFDRRSLEAMLDLSSHYPNDVLYASQAMRGAPRNLPPHFGFTLFPIGLLRPFAEKFHDLFIHDPHPDVSFWKQSALPTRRTKILVGHLDSLVAWPNGWYQHINDYDLGNPPNIRSSQ